MPALKPGQPLPRITLDMVDGGDLELGLATGQWQMLVVYRGRHCPRCKTYLSKLDRMQDAFAERGVRVVIASADPLVKAQADVAEFGWTLPCAYGLSEADMAALGLYISDPSSPQETDRRFAEPGLYVTNAEDQLHVVGLSNAASCRPDLDVVLDGIRGIQTKNLPVRGTVQ
ncbi:MAG: redoxin domain-containing protein [Rhodospirillales bacterium]|nr:redoxin domain-containing protein [Rhodospirillales bacterium]